MAPIELSVLLHYAETAEPITSRTDTPRTELLDRIGDHLVKDGLLMRGGDERPFCLTRKGEFFVHHLLTTPLPVEEVVYRIPPREEP